MDSQPKREPAVVTEDVKEKLEEWQRNLSELWGKYGGEIIISYALICALVLRHVDIQRNIPIYCCRFLV